MSVVCPIVLSAVLAFPAAAAGLTPAQWEQDVDAFARELPRRHINAFHNITREQFDAAVAALRARAASANDDEMYTGLLQITAMVGDGHTFVSGYSHPRRIPIAVALFGDDVRVVRATEASSALLGGRIVRIEATPIGAVLTKVRSILSQDESEEYVHGLLPGWIISCEALHGLGIAADPSHLRVTVERDGSEQTVDLGSIPLDAALPLLARTGPPPIYAREPDNGFEMVWIEASKTMYVNFRSYANLNVNARGLWILVDSKPVEKIVFDLRQNGGGDYKVGHRDLVSELAKRPRLHAYVLIGNRTFSAAMNNAIQFRDEAHAMLVGQPIGEKPNSYQERRSFTLPNSRLQVSVSTQFYKFLPDNVPNQVLPDKRIDTTWDDFVAGRDPVLDWVLDDKGGSR